MGTSVHDNSLNLVVLDFWIKALLSSYGVVCSLWTLLWHKSRLLDNQSVWSESSCILTLGSIQYVVIQLLTAKVRSKHANLYWTESSLASNNNFGILVLFTCSVRKAATDVNLPTSTWCLQVFGIICSNTGTLSVLIQCSSGLASMHLHRRCYWL